MNGIFPLAYYHHGGGLFGSLLHGAFWGFGSSAGRALFRALTLPVALAVIGFAVVFWLMMRAR